MPKKEVRRAEAFRRWNAECREFFDNTTDIRGERNWELLHPMSLLYLAYLLFYLLLICPVMDMPLRTNAVRIFVVVQAFFTMWIFLHAKETPPARVVNMVIIVFAVQILGLSGFLGIAVFTNEASFLFPICLILMTQIYTWRPVFPITVVLVSAAVYLVFCWRTKDVYVFAMDLLSISCALGIAGVALFSVVGYKMRAYRAQTALQKMCALDPMTGVNNKATFEFLVEDFLRDFPAGRHALAVCDFD